MSTTTAAAGPLSPSPRESNPPPPLREKATDFVCVVCAYQQAMPPGVSSNHIEQSLCLFMILPLQNLVAHIIEVVLPQNVGEVLTG